MPAHHSRLVAIVGRANVGKSTLFNRIIKENRSLVYDQPGVTRDRIFARAEHNGDRFFLCDTGGFEPVSKDNIKRQLVEQAELAIEEADLIIFVADVKEGIHPYDQELIRRIRKAEKSFIVVVNKCDSPMEEYAAEEFRKLGIPHLYSISAAHNRGIGDVLDHVVSHLHSLPRVRSVSEDAVHIALIGRPNVGKSSILNRIAGEVRSIVDNRPGTTRDTTDTHIKYHGKELVVLDTAGIRRKSRMADRIEKYSAIRALSAIEDCDVAILVIDALEGPTEGDARVVGAAFELKKPIMIVVNKWDLIEKKHSNSTIEYNKKLRQEIRYLGFAPVIYISALENQRVSKIIPQCLDLHGQAGIRVSTGQVNKALKDILTKHTPPLRKNRSKRIKFYYATQVTAQPPRFVVFCSAPKELHFSYKRFVENEFRKAFGFENIPLTIYFRERSRKQMNDLISPAPRHADPTKHTGAVQDDLLGVDFDEGLAQEYTIEYTDDETYTEENEL